MKLGGSCSVAWASRWHLNAHCWMPFGSRQILNTVGTAIPATARWWFAAWRCGLCRSCFGKNLPAPLIELRLGPSWVSPGWFSSGSCLGWSWTLPSGALVIPAPRRVEPALPQVSWAGLLRERVGVLPHVRSRWWCRQSHSTSAVPVCFTQSKHLEVVAMHFSTYLCRFPCLI